MAGKLSSYGTSFRAGSFLGENVPMAVNNGSLPVSLVDDIITRIMTPYYFLGQVQYFSEVDPSSADLNTFSPPASWIRKFNLTGTRSRDVCENHGELIRRHYAAASALLKYEKGALPLKAPKSIAVFGNSAGDITEGFCNQADFEYGTLFSGGGFGTGRLTYLVNPSAASNARAKQALGSHAAESLLSSQLYVTFSDSAPEGTPPRQSRNFDKIFLSAGETGKATFEIMQRDFSYWDTHAQEWLIPGGEFTISVGFSSRDLKKSAQITPVV